MRRKHAQSWLLLCLMTTTTLHAATVGAEDPAADDLAAYLRNVSPPEDICKDVPQVCDLVCEGQNLITGATVGFKQTLRKHPNIQGWYHDDDYNAIGNFYYLGHDGTHHKYYINLPGIALKPDHCYGWGVRPEFLCSPFFLPGQQCHAY
jgi:hypothetical protein